jgi:hypothetical protein
VREAARRSIPDPVRAPRQRHKGRVPSPCGELQSTLIPTGRVGQASHSGKDRTRSKRLNGADIYVTRMGWKSGTTNGASSCCPEPSRDADISPPPANRKTGSLHDELTHSSRTLRHRSTLPDRLRISSPLSCLQDHATDASRTWLRSVSDERSGLRMLVRGRAPKSGTL